MLPGVALFSLGLAMTVAPLTAAVLAAVDERHAGIASGVNNAVARVAGLVAIAALGAIVAVQFSASLDRQLAGVRLPRPPKSAVAEPSVSRSDALRLRVSRRARPREITDAANAASLESFRPGIGIAGGSC